MQCLLFQPAGEAQQACIKYWTARAHHRGLVSSQLQRQARSCTPSELSRGKREISSETNEYSYNHSLAEYFCDRRSSTWKEKKRSHAHTLMSSPNNARRYALSNPQPVPNIGHISIHPPIHRPSLCQRVNIMIP